MEAKLKEYRALRRRRELGETNKDNIDSKQSVESNLITSSDNMIAEIKDDEALLIPLEEEKNSENELQDVVSVTSDVESFEDYNQETWTYYLTKWGLYLIIWLTLYAIFLKLQFGSVFFAVSVLIGICVNTRTRPKKLGEVSAYSVFNEDCKSIEGTLTAEQFEQEIRFGPGSVR